MATRTARTEWSGGLRDGSGTTTLVSSGLGSYDVSFPKRESESADGTTSPEELLGAAHSACYCMQLSGVIGMAGGTVRKLTAQADVGFGPDPAGGFRVTGITLTVRGTVEGIDEAAFLEAANQAKATCPVSKALTGVEITLDAALA